MIEFSNCVVSLRNGVIPKVRHKTGQETKRNSLAFYFLNAKKHAFVNAFEKIIALSLLTFLTSNLTVFM